MGGEQRSRLPTRQLILFYTVEAIVITGLFLWLYHISARVENITIRTENGIRATFFTLGVLAFLFGLRHAVDADHLAAIDNATRKLVQEGKDAHLTGFFFSLGHSTVVILLSIALMVATRFVANEIPAIENVGTIIGTLVSGGFLYLIGFLNFFVLLEIYDIYKQVKKGELDEDRLNKALLERGFMSKYFKKLFKIIDKQTYMYPIGFLFGLGFDTASETALLAISAAVAGVFAKIPLWTLLVFPFLFTAGMLLLDTTDGFFMYTAYNWAFTDILGKVWYNLTMTLISVLVAYAVGTIELLGLIQGEFNLTGPFWNLIASLNGDRLWTMIGFLIIGVFAGTWAISYTVYKLRVRKSFQASPTSIRSPGIQSRQQ